MATVTRSLRLLDLVHYLGGRRSRTLKEVVDRFGVSERTVYRDLADLSAQHIPVCRDDYGYRLMETATLRPLNLNAEEHALLKVALHNPALRRHPSLRQRLDALEAKLDAATALAEETPKALQLAGIDRSGPSAEEALEPLRLAIGRGQSVDLRYHSLSGGKRQWRRVDPWRLFQRSEAWYLVGHCHRNREPRMFRLDRVGGVRGRQERFKVPRDLDLERFLEHSWGLVVGDQTWDVELRFDPSLEPLLLNARHHRGEKVKKLRDGAIDYRVKLSSLDEIAAWVVGFGGKCRVVGPPGLKAKVEEMARGVLGPPTPPD